MNVNVWDVNDRLREIVGTSVDRDELARAVRSGGVEVEIVDALFYETSPVSGLKKRRRLGEVLLGGRAR